MRSDEGESLDAEARLRALTDLTTPWCVRVAVTVGAIDRLAVAGPQTAVELAEATGCDAYALGLVLRQLARSGVLAEEPSKVFGLTPIGEVLTVDHVRALYDLGGIGGRYANIWSGLLPATRSGASVYHKVFGKPFWVDLGEHPDVADSYDVLNGPEGHPPTSMRFDVAGGWPSVQTVILLGGSVGGHLAELLALHPHLQGTLLDFQRVVDGAMPVFVDRGVADRVSFVGQSFFEPLPAGFDVYLVVGTLRVWADPQVRKLLRRCAEAMTAESRLVLVDDVVPDDYDEPDGYEDLLTLMVGGRSARRKTLQHFTGLAADAGLAVTVAEPQLQWPLVVECRAALAPPP